MQTRRLWVEDTAEPVSVELVQVRLPELGDREVVLPRPMSLACRANLWDGLALRAAAGVQNAQRGAAARIWFRLFPDVTLHPHRFKRAHFRRFLSTTMNGKEKFLTAQQLVARLREVGRAGRDRRRPLDAVLTSMHFDNAQIGLSEVDQQRAARFWDAHCAEVVATEEKFFDDKGIARGQTISPGELLTLNRNLGRRLQTFRTRARNAGVRDDALDLEAVVRVIETESLMQAGVLRALEPHLDDFGKAVYRFLHMTSGRAAGGLFVPVPCSFSAPLRSALEFFGGFIDHIDCEEAWILADLLAVLGGVDPRSTAVVDAVDIAHGFAFAFDGWVDRTRESQRESKRGRDAAARRASRVDLGHGFRDLVTLGD